MSQKDYLINLQLEQGWKIDINSINSFPIYENTIVFSAINKIIGKELYIEFENEKTGYILTEVLVDRNNFVFNFDDESSKIYNIITSNLDLNELISFLNKKTNPNNLNLVKLKVYGGWEIVLNRLYNINNYSEKDFLFLGIKNKNIIEVLFIKGIGYKVNIGNLRNKNITNCLEHKNLDILSSKIFKSLNSLVDFMENYFTAY